MIRFASIIRSPINALFSTLFSKCISIYMKGFIVKSKRSEHTCYKNHNNQLTTHAHTQAKKRMVSVNTHWRNEDFFKGFLTPPSRLHESGFVILAYKRDSTQSSDDSQSTTRFSGAPNTFSQSVEDGNRKVCSFLLSNEETSSGVSPPPVLDSCALQQKPEKLVVSHRDPCSKIRTDKNEQNGEGKENVSSPLLLNSPLSCCDASIEFSIFHREDVEGQLKNLIEDPDKNQRCFYACMEKDCNCNLLHVRENAWRRRVDTISQSTELVCFNESCVARVRQQDVRPTAGYYYALGLREEGVQQVFPRLCCRGQECEYGVTCLYIHLVHHITIPVVRYTATTRLSTLVSDSEHQRVLQFLLEKRDLNTVGDIQMMSNDAFDALMEEAPPETLEVLLSVSTYRFFTPQSELVPVVSTFPHLDISDIGKHLDPYRLVSDVLRLSTTELYASPRVSALTNVFELIRKRFIPSSQLHSTTLNNMNRNGFVRLAVQNLLSMGKEYAHCSWRRHDPSRPIVVSMITFVDVKTCQCGVRMQQPSHIFTNDTPVYHSGMQKEKLLPAPHDSWCECPRMWEAAVNYELNTSMGARCAEQNAIGVIARCGAPTWALREVMVYGTRPSREVNPLFPCGVCENMLRKVDKDVQSLYGRPLMLYMFDAVIPTKVFSLPLPAISMR